MPRVIGVLIVSFAVMLLLGPVIIPLLQRLKFGQPIRDDGPESHKLKQGTPTMGGIMLCAAIAIPALLFSTAEGRGQIMLPGVLFSLGCSAIGFLDDYLKVVRKNPKGLRGWYKVAFQVIISLALALYCYFSPMIGSAVYIPFTDVLFDMGIWYIPFAVFVIIAAVNSANLTDGVDGLLGGVTLIIAATFAVIALYAINLFDAGVARNVAVLAAAVAGACLGFLRFNTTPARVFMGDTGSFLLGGAVAYIALALRLPLLLPVACVTYLASSLSVIMQRAYFKLTHGKRIFRMSPLHHHFELGGMPEAQIVAMYMSITFIACLVSLWGVSS